jgi:hypothetical protein
LTKSTSAAVAAVLMILMIALACGGEAGDTPADSNSSRTEKATPEESSTQPEIAMTEDEPEAAPEEEAEETPEPRSAGPERIRFKRGTSQGRITLDLAPNETRKYVVGVGPAQDFHIGIDDFRPAISVPNASRLTEIEEGDNFFSAVTISTGDIVFEISNPTRGSVRTFALVTITDREPMDH